MKRTFSAKHSLFSSTNFSWGTYALGIAILLLAARLLMPNLFWHAAAPVFGAANALVERSHALFGGFGDAAVLALENEALNEENAALALRNRTLEKKLGETGVFTPETGGIVAGVVARPPTSPYDTLVVGVGAKMGVTEGMAAFGAPVEGSGAAPLGVVSAVLPDFSRVTLFSSPGIVVHGWVGSANVPIAIEGAGGGSMSASVPRAAGIMAGDAVFIPGVEAVPVGVVARLDGDPSSPSVTLRITPSFNLFSTTYVELRPSGAVLMNAVASATPPLP